MAELLEYKCPACGGALEFNSELQKMKCHYCDSEFDMETLKSLDEELAASAPDNIEWSTTPNSGWSEDETQNMRVYSCRSCGGQIVGDATTGASSCPYCGNPVVMAGSFSGDLRPDYIIPFKLDKNAAKAALKNHMKGKRLLPKVFSDENHIDEIKGIYVPFWIFNADVDANVRYKATKTKSWESGDYRYTETDYYSVFRSGSIGFDNIPVDGSQKMDNSLMESLEPFHMEEAVDFQTAYMAGYLADKYDVNESDSIERANKRVKNSTEQAFISTVSGYSSVIPESSSISLSNGQAKYALLPVWILNTNWQNKKYTFAMNGQTGKFVGDLPLDKKAYWKWFWLLSLIFSLAAFAALAILFI